jgi:hypothetical protein
MLARRQTIVNESNEWRLAIQRSHHADHPTYARSNYTTVAYMDVDEKSKTLAKTGETLAHA